MAIQSILIQPAEGSLNSAYRPIILRVVANSNSGGAAPPVVYCDIQFNSQFYKTLSKTHYSKLNAETSEWEFDIQDAMQEIVTYALAPNGGSSLFDAYQVAASIQCLFRCSGINSDGFIEYDLPAPVQGTGNNPPVTGNNEHPSNNFKAVNATLQHEDNQSLETHLSFYKNGIWNENCFPLTHRPNGYTIGINDSDYFPVLTRSAVNVDAIRLYYMYVGQSNYHQIAKEIEFLNSGDAFYIPAGTKNLSQLFDIDFKQVAKYYVEVSYMSAPLATTNVYDISLAKDDIVRIHFLNYAGGIDAVNMILQTAEHNPKSEAWEKPLSYPLSKSQHGANRFNVESNDTYTAITIDYDEQQLSWLDELKDSPVAWIEWNGSQGQDADYLPIVITDSKSSKINTDERFYTEVSLTFTMSNRKIVLRN